MSPARTTTRSVSTRDSPAATAATGPPPGGDSRVQRTARRVGRSGPTTTSGQSAGRPSRRWSRTVAPPRVAVVLSEPIRREAPPQRTRAVATGRGGTGAGTGSVGLGDAGGPHASEADRLVDVGHRV